MIIAVASLLTDSKICNLISSDRCMQKYSSAQELAAEQDVLKAKGMVLNRWQSFLGNKACIKK